MKEKKTRCSNNVLVKLLHVEVLLVPEEQELSFQVDKAPVLASAIERFSRLSATGINKQLFQNQNLMMALGEKRGRRFVAGKPGSSC